METSATQSVSYVQHFKCLVLGDKGVCKSCLMQQFTDHTFPPEYDPTIGVEFSKRILTIDGDKRTKLQIWDVNGQEPFRCISRSYYSGAAAAILAYDITRRETFDHLPKWLEDATQLGPPNLTLVLLGNKCDMSDKRAVSYDEGEEFAKEHGLVFMESSAKTGCNVEDAFTDAATIVSRKIDCGTIDSSAKSALRRLDEMMPPSKQPTTVSGSGACFSFLDLSGW
ncbi:hypothetical protein ACP4OV_011953 [Aristida adscensionis]